MTSTNWTKGAGWKHHETRAMPLHPPGSRQVALRLQRGLESLLVSMTPTEARALAAGLEAAARDAEEEST